MDTHGYSWHWHPWVDWDTGYPWHWHGILGQSSILDNLQGRLGQCGLGQDWDNGYPLDIHGMGHWHPWVDWDSVCKSMDTHWISMALADWDNVGSCLQGGLGQSATHWISMALASLGRLGPGQSSILDNLQGRLGQCGTGLGSGLGQWIPIGYSWHWHPWVDWDSVESWDNLRS